MKHENGPHLILRSFLGNVLFTPDSLYSELKAPIYCQVDLSDVLGKDFGEHPLNAVHLYPSTQINILSSRHIENGPADYSKSGLLFNSSGGRRQVSFKDFISRVKVENPHIVIIPADEVSLSSSWSQCGKAAVKSQAWLQQVTSAIRMEESRCALYGVAVPSRPVQSYEEGVQPASLPVIHSLAKAATDLVSMGLQGVVVGGMGLGETVQELRLAVAAVRAAVGPSIPVAVQGMDSISQIITCVAAGASLVSSNLPTILTGRRHALHWNLEAKYSRGSKRSADFRGESPGSKVMRADETDSTSDVSVGEAAASSSVEGGAAAAGECVVSAAERSPSIIDIGSADFRRDRRPLLEGCECHACRHHTRAYIHHLVVAKELLGEVLIFNHNQWQLLLLFEAMKGWTAEDADHFMLQYC